METQLFTFLAGAAIGFLSCIVITHKLRVNEAPPSPVDYNALMLQQMQAQQLQNALRGSQLEQVRQEAELLSLTRERNMVAKLNYSDIQRLAGYVPSDAQSQHIPH